MILLAATAFLMALITAVHVFVGARTDVVPLLSSDIPEPARSTLYFCWHLVSIMLVAMTIAFALAAADDQYRLLGLAATALAAAFTLWGVLAAVVRRQSLITKLPQGLMFAVVTALAVVGLKL